MDKELHRAAWVSAVVNIGLTIAKGSVGLASGSRALFADAVHSATDVVGSLVVVIGLRIARKPPDDDHPYGHGKAELISAAIVAAFLLIAGVQIGYSAIKSLFTAPEVPGVAAAYTAAVAIAVKEVMYQYNYRVGKRLHSRSMLASAKDHRSDVFSSLAALVGIVLALLGRRFGVGWLLYMDAVASGLVAILVFRMGYRIGSESFQLLMDKAVQENHLDPYVQLIRRVAGVVQIDGIRARDHGQYVIVDVEISVDASISVAAGHDIATRVKEQLIDAFPRVLDVFVHVNPYLPEMSHTAVSKESR